MTEIAIAKSKSDEIPKQQLRLTLLIGKEGISIDTFWYRWFVYEIWNCLKCVRLQFAWKKGIAEGFCGYRPCEFRERWDI